MGPTKYKGPSYARAAPILDSPNYVPPRGHLNAMEYSFDNGWKPIGASAQPKVCFMGPTRISGREPKAGRP
jgi:hypothetical protein